MENRNHNITEKTTLGKQDSRDGSCCLRQDKRTVHLSREMTLGELLDFLKPGEKPGETPTSRELRETAGAPVASEERCLVYRSGWAVYDNGSGRTVLWLPDCVSFTYQFIKPERNEAWAVPAGEELPEGLLASQPWPIAVTLVGDHCIEKNSMNRSGSRAGRKVHDDIFDDGSLEEDEGENCFLKRLFRQPQYMAENPEDNFIRKEMIHEILSAMTKKQRKAVILHCVYGYTEKETAGKLGITQPAVSALLKNAEQIAKEIV